jgi:RNA methyltransferase, TrmH family
MPTDNISPLSHTKAAFIRQLVRHKKVRDAEQRFVLEGVKSIRDALSVSDSSVCWVVVSTGWLSREPTFGDQLRRTRIYVCREAVFETLSDLTTSAGILAVVRKPVWSEERIFKRAQLFGFYGECLQDPINVGAIVRTALAFGLDGLWLSSESADVFNPKVVRASSGAVLHLPIFITRDTSRFVQEGCALLAAQAQKAGSRSITDITTIPKRAVIALGNESRGLSADMLQRATVRFHIPISAAMESLNVAASAAIAAFYFRSLRAG